MPIEIDVKVTGPGKFMITKGAQALDMALASKDEVCVIIPGFGPLLIYRLPDGSLSASDDPKLIATMAALEDDILHASKTH